VKGRTRRRPAVWAVAGVLILATAIAGTLWLRPRPTFPPPTVVQLTSERWAGAGSFSPDGTQIAYASAGEDGANWDIWVKLVGQAEARRLTTDPAAEDHPAWSPDGTQIAFLRYYAGTTRGLTRFAVGAIHLVSPLGGPARRLSDIPARLQLSWSPAGRWLAASKAVSGSDPPGGIYLVSIATGDARAVTSPKPNAFDMSPSFSPDGRELAYFACEGPYTLPLCDLYVVPLDSGLTPSGAARRLTRERIKEGGGLAWARDGRSIVYDGLWRVRADGGAPPERVEAAAGGRFPSLASGRDRLAFVRPIGDTDIYRLPQGGTPTAIVQSTFPELQPQYSPDGRRIAFTSERSGSGQEIWIADADGQNLTRVTRGPGGAQGWPGWSPDGRTVVFDSVAEDGNRDVWTINVDGSDLRRITRDPAHDILPSWSHDGHFIYFSSNRTGRREVWRVPPGGGSEEQLTHEGGAFPLESVDGRTLYYLKKAPADGPLMGRPTAGGDERTILPCAHPFGYAVAPRGILHLACLTQEAGGSPQRTLLFWDATTGQDRPLATVTADVIASLSVSPDGRSIVYGGGLLTSDLMMIESFR
jgi:eukaryotic-like serine/threonine-protein kinase